MGAEFVVEPWFTSTQGAGLQDFWQVYTTHYEQIVQASLDAALEDPHFGPIVRAIPPEAAQAQRKESFERLRLAITEGQWGQYEARLRKDGATYAKMGIVYSAWARLIRAYLKILYPSMVTTFSAEPARLAEAIVISQEYLDKAMTVIVESYLETKEALIRESEENLAVTLDSIGDAVLVTDNEGCIQRLNPVAEKLMGWTLAECKGKPMLEVFHIKNEETGVAAENPVERVLKEGTLVGLANHTVLISRDGTSYPIADSAAPIQGEDGKIRGVVLVFRDVTQEHQAEAALRKSEQTLSATLESLHEGVSILDNSGKFVFANHATHTLWELLSFKPNENHEQWSRQATVFYTDGETPCPPEERPMARALRGEKVQDLELYFLTPAVPQGGLYLNINVNPILDKDGNHLGFVSIYRDVSYRKRLEEAQEESRRIQESSRLKSEFLANMSHELRTPLNSIIGFSELLHDEEVGPISAQQKEFLEDVLTSGRHLLQLISDVLDLSKIEAGKLEFHPEPFELERVIGEVLSILRTIAAKKNISIEVSLDPEIKEVVLDPGRLKQVLYNYLSNALKFTPNDGSIKVRVLHSGSLAFRLEVEDNGIGISPQNLVKLFREFEQLDGGTAKTHAGTGLGLALTKRLVEAQGGSVGVTSTPHQGSTFFAILPRCAELSAQPTNSQVIEAQTTDAARILVVEDDPVDRERIVQMLVKAGYAVETASTGRQALMMSQQKRYDAITLDLLLPDMNGLEVLRTIQSDHHNLPIVVITVVTEQATVGFAVHDTLSKPINGQRLVDSLRRAGVSPDKASKILVVDDDENSLKLMRTTLERLGYQTIGYQKTELALLATSTEKVSAVILDLVMPELDGFHFLAHFRREPRNASIPVLIWTSKELTKKEHRGLYQSAHVVIQKEAGISELVTALRLYLSETRGS
jgi:PAS domain S-box-containing protein